MKYLLSFLGAIAIVFNVCHTAQAQQELLILRAASTGQGAQETFYTTYQHTIKYARQATLTSGFVIDTSERIDDNTYIILGKKPMANDPYGEVIRVLVTRKSATATNVRILVRRAASVGTNHELHYADKIYADIHGQTGLASI